MTNKDKSAELKFAPQGSGKTTTATYNTVKEAIVNHIQKNYKNGQDVAKSIKQMRKLDLSAVEPTLSISTNNEAAAKELEQAGYNIKYQEELRHHMDRSGALDEGLSKAYALIFNNYCTKAIQSRIEEHPDF